MMIIVVKEKLGVLFILLNDALNIVLSLKTLFKSYVCMYLCSTSLV